MDLHLELDLDSELDLVKLKWKLAMVPLFNSLITTAHLRFVE